MIVKCTNCGTKFRVKEDLIPPEGRNVRCSKCKNVFFIKLPSTIDEEKKPVKEEKKEDFSFEEPEKKVKESGEDIFHLTEDELPEPEKKVQEKVQEAKDEDIEKDIEKIVEKYKDPSFKKKVKQKKSSKFSLAITIAMLIIAIFVGATFIFMKSKNKVPPFKFQNLTANFYENKAFKQVLVVRGELTNLKSYAFKRIKLKALIYDDSGKKIKEAVTYLGNIYSKDEILNMTPELAKKFVFTDVVLKPKASMPFMIFVFNLPKKSYSFQVMVMQYEKIK